MEARLVNFLGGVVGDVGKGRKARADYSDSCRGYHTAGKRFFTFKQFGSVFNGLEPGLSMIT